MAHPFAFAILFYLLLSGALTASVARSKGREWWRWFVYGAAFGPFAWIAIRILPSRRAAEGSTSSRPSP